MTAQLAFRRLLVLALAASLGACSALQPLLPSKRPAQVPAASQSKAYASPEPKTGQWPQAVSDIPADPDIRFGTLPNGMRYAIQRNATPTRQVSLRLHINAGSIDEAEGEQGLAHFLEHMAFKGSANVPENQMIPTLERLGLGFGPDTNASTSWNETVYMLDLPRNDEDSLSTGIKLMRETAGNLTLAQSGIDSERGVVLSEERARDTPAYRVSVARIGFLLVGQRVPTRFPIGKTEVISNAQAGAMRGLYERYYRPEHATLIAAGDFDPAQMEARIRAAFSDWTGKGAAGGEPDGGSVAVRGQQTKVVVEPGAASSVQIAWVQPAETGVNTKARLQRDLTVNLGLAVLNRRLQQMARGAAPPFIGASGGQSDYLHAAKVTSLSASFRPGEWRPALTAIDAEQRRLATFGVRQDELDREIADWRVSLQAAVDGAATRRTPDLAETIADSVDARDIVTSPAQDLALFDQAVKTANLASVNAAIKTAFSGQGPLIFLTSPTPIEGGEGVVTDAYRQSQRTAVTALAAPTATAWPYDSFGAPGRVTARTGADDLGADFITFANGVKLIVKSTKFTNDQILVQARVGAGVQSLAKDAAPIDWISSFLVAGGLKQISMEDTERVLTGKVWGADFAMDADAFEFSGSTTRKDLETQMQVLTAYVSEPGWRAEAFERQKTFALTQLDQLAATDGGVLSRDLPGLLHPGDQRFAFPNRAQMSAMTLDGLKAQIEPGLASGPIEVIMVGDVSVEEAIELTGATFGALPPRPAANPPGDQKTTAFPEGGGPIIVRTHTGRADQAIAYVAWKTGDFFADTSRARTMNVLGQVIENRLIDELRTKQGATYSPQAGSSASFIWPGWGSLSISLEVAPDKLAGVEASINDIVAALAAAPPTEDELARVKAPIAEQLLKARQTNTYWLGALAAGSFDPRRLDALRSVQAGLARVSAADVQQAARTYLTPANQWRLEVRPENR